MIQIGHDHGLNEVAINSITTNCTTSFNFQTTLRICVIAIDGIRLSRFTVFTKENRTL